MSVTPSQRVVVGLNDEGKSTAVDVGPIPLYEFDSDGENLDDTLWGANVEVVEHDPTSVFKPGRPDAWGDDDPPAAGAVFRLINFPPHSGFDLHTTQTIDVGLVISGEVWLILEDGEVLLRAEDCSILHGEVHGWANRSDQPCKLFGVLMSTARPDSW